MPDTAKLALVDAEDVELAFDVPLIRNLTLTVASGRRVGLTGRSGLGKTKFVEAIMYAAIGERSPAFRHGRFAIGAGAIGYAPQRVSVPRWFQVGAFLDRLAQRARPARRDGLVELRRRFGLDPLASAFPRTLSGGEMQRVSVAAALSLADDLLVLDEPLTALDLATKIELVDASLSFLDRHSIGLMVVSHDLDLLLRLAQEVHVLGPSGIAGTVTVDPPDPEGGNRDAAMDRQRAMLLAGLKQQESSMVANRSPGASE